MKVFVLAKAPRAGLSKTRLSPPLTEEQAVDLQRALLLDTVAACRQEIPDTAILCPDEQHAAELRTLLGDSIPVVPQDGVGVADATRLVLKRFLPEQPVAVVGSDIPGTPPGELTWAQARLAHGTDAVVGPGLDGGYWLFAACTYDERVFEIPWGTPAAFAATVRRCREAGLSVEVAAQWPDVDTIVDLAVLASRADELPPHTREALASLDLPLSPELPPRVEASEIVYETDITAVLHERLRPAGGPTTEITFMAMPKAVVVVPVTAQDQVVLLRRYRHAVRVWTRGLPTASIEPGESPLDAAGRALRSAVGGEAAEWERLTAFYPAGDALALSVQGFLARDVRLLDAEKRENLSQIPFDLAVEQARTGALPEAETALALMVASAFEAARRGQ
jgi:uncharacterized protein